MSDTSSPAPLSWWQRLFPWTRPKLSEVARFDFERQLSRDFGETFQPVARVDFWSPSLKDWHQVVSVIDTGADITILPSYLASFIGLKYSKKDQLQTLGLGGQVVVYLATEVKIKIGSAERIVPVGITTQAIPPLLGRQACLDTFKVCFDHQRQTIFSSY